MKKRPAPRAAADPAVGPGVPPARVSALPAARDLLDPRLPFLVPLVLLVVARLVAWRELPFASEDAYITFRFARSLAGGYGLVYNPGVPVFGFSSPLWTLWCALGIALTNAPVPWTRATTLLADALTLVLVVRMLQREGAADGRDGRLAAWAFAVFFAAWPYFSVVAASGMETSAMLTLVALAAAALRGGTGAPPRGGRALLPGLLLGALALWRPEGIAAALVLAAGARRRDRLVGAAILAAGLVALALYFGSPVPQSLAAKSALYGTPGPWAGRYWWSWLVPAYLGGVPSIGETRMLFPLAVLTGPAAVAGAAALWRGRARAAFWLAAAGLAVWAGYAALGVAFFYWYFVVPLAAAAVLAAVGLPRVTRGRWLPAAAALLVASAWVEAYPLYVGRAQNEFFGFARTADWLAAHARPGEKVMLEPIGMVGWRVPVVVVDEVGLVSPGVARRRLRGPGWYADVAAAERPDWIVIRRGLLSSESAFAGAGAPFRSAAERDSLFARYQAAAVVDLEAADANALVVMRRRAETAQGSSR